MRLAEPKKKHRVAVPIELRWLDLLKAFAVLWIFLNHAVERVLGFPFIANPNADWPPLRDRVLQLMPVDYGGAISDVFLNALQYLGWAGDQGVQLFLIASGFGLTWRLLHSDRRDGWVHFFLRRLVRIYPLWWGVHIAFLVASVFLGRGLQLTDPRFLLSFIGFRATPQLMYYFAPAWWYIGLMIQLYLVYPILASGLRRLGVSRFLGITLGVSFVVRLVGLYTFTGYLDAWSRGGFFITRLPEFAFGMALAWWLQTRPDETDRFLRRSTTLLLASLVYIVSIGLSLTLWGMTVAPFLQGIALFTLGYSVFRAWSGRPLMLSTALLWVGLHSYSLYLVHHSVIIYLIDRTEHPSLGDLALFIPAFGISVAGAVGLEKLVEQGRRVSSQIPRLLANRQLTIRAAILLIALAAFLMTAEVMVRVIDPQEVYGWGERPSLQPDDELGWKLIPSQTTRLRWESYDYVIQANALGFPGPLYPETRTPGTLRIMTLGDAFTSAEGVDTDEAWPRLLERALASRLGPGRVEVFNFAITGYGPNQYSAVLRKYGRRFRPDVIVVGLFVNEYFDVLVSDDDFRHSIGFQLSPQSGLRGYLGAVHLRKWLSLRLLDPLRELIPHSQKSHGYFLGNIASLETGSGGITEAGREAVALRLDGLARQADDIDAELILLIIPAPVQVCGPDSLRYLPRGVDLEDTETYDMNRPQRITEQIADEIDLATYDLRKPLEELPSCPYQPHNMHWLAIGHEAVARFVSEALIRDGHIQQLTTSQEED